jgi:hypothetical protein
MLKGKHSLQCVLNQPQSAAFVTRQMRIKFRISFMQPCIFSTETGSVSHIVSQNRMAHPLSASLCSNDAPRMVHLCLVISKTPPCCSSMRKNMAAK